MYHKKCSSLLCVFNLYLSQLFCLSNYMSNTNKYRQPWHQGVNIASKIRNAESQALTHSTNFQNLNFKAFFNCSFWSQYDVHHVDAFISSNSTFNDTLILVLISEAWISLTIKPCMDTKQNQMKPHEKFFDHKGRGIRLEDVANVHSKWGKLKFFYIST